MTFKESLWFRNGPALVRAAAELKVAHILCGHTHIRMRYKASSASDVWVHCAGAACCASEHEDTSIHLYTIQVDNGAVTFRDSTFVFNPDPEVVSFEKADGGRVWTKDGPLQVTET